MRPVARPTGRIAQDMGGNARLFIARTSQPGEKTALRSRFTKHRADMTALIRAGLPNRGVATNPAMATRRPVTADLNILGQTRPTKPRDRRRREIPLRTAIGITIAAAPDRMRGVFPKPKLLGMLATAWARHKAEARRGALLFFNIAHQAIELIGGGRKCRTRCNRHSQTPCRLTQVKPVSRLITATSIAPPTVWSIAMMRFLKMLRATNSSAVSAKSWRVEISTTDSTGLI